MRTPSLAVAVVAALGFAAGPVIAADMPVKAVLPVMPALYNWTGLYVGVEGGGVMGQTSHWFELSAIDPFVKDGPVSLLPVKGVIDPVM